LMATRSRSSRMTGSITPNANLSVVPSNRVVAITGASAGIGRAVAVRLARDGASIAICARRRDRLDAAAADIDRTGGIALSIVADLTSEEEMTAFVAQTVERFGRLDVMM